MRIDDDKVMNKNQKKIKMVNKVGVMNELSALHNKACMELKNALDDYSKPQDDKDAERTLIAIGLHQGIKFMTERLANNISEMETCEIDSNGINADVMELNEKEVAEYVAGLLGMTINNEDDKENK